MSRSRAAQQRSLGCDKGARGGASLETPLAALVFCGIDLGALVFGGIDSVMGLYGVLLLCEVSQGLHSHTPTRAHTRTRADAHTHTHRHTNRCRHAQREELGCFTLGTPILFSFVVLKLTKAASYCKANQLLGMSWKTLPCLALG